MKLPKTLLSKRRRAFTLIELLVVILIMAILVTLVIRAAGGAIKRARITGMVTEISQLEAAIAKFKADHGIEPPSSITLYENGVSWASDTTGSAALVRQIWPQYDFANHDINGNGTPTTTTSTDGETIVLTLGECLVFFLGGVNGNTTPGTTTAPNNNPDNGLTTYIGPCTGFSKNPANPFSRGGTREAPLFEFQPSRFTDLDPGGGDGFPEYRDGLPSQTMPYLYYSSYDGQGYAELTEFGSPGLTLAYRQDPILSNYTFWKPNSHQIISPGYDRAYGYGGAYLPTSSIHLPLGTSATTPPVLPTAAQRAYEADNITNFSSGELGP